MLVVSSSSVLCAARTLHLLHACVARPGIGLETVRTFAKMGATVILAARGGPTRLAQAVEAAKVGVRGNQAGTIIGMELDLSSFASIHTFVQEFLAEHTQLHLLVNNAGVMMCPYSLTADGLEMQIGTNHFGHFLLTSLLIDTLAASKARVVTVSSLGHALVERLTYPKQNDPKKYDKMVAYSDSKLANIYFTQELARRYADKGIEAVAVHPGCVDTPLARHLSSKTHTREQTQAMHCTPLSFYRSLTTRLSLLSLPQVFSSCSVVRSV